MDRDELLRRFPAHRARLVASLARLVGPAEAEDLAQETLLRALSAVEGFRGEAALGTWLHRIGVNLAHDLLRRRRASPVLPAAAGGEVPEAATEAVGETLLEQRQMSQCLREVLATLPASQRGVLVQADMLERSMPEIAADAGITTGNAKIRLHRARRAMKAALHGACAFYHGPRGGTSLRAEAGALTSSPYPFAGPHRQRGVPIGYFTRSHIMLDEKTKELVAVGASITAHCQPCLEYHTAKARELGATTEELLAAVAVGQQVRRGAATKMDRFAARHVGGETVPEPAPACDCR